MLKLLIALLICVSAVYAGDTPVQCEGPGPTVVSTCLGLNQACNNATLSGVNVTVTADQITISICKSDLLCGTESKCVAILGFNCSGVEDVCNSPFAGLMPISFGFDVYTCNKTSQLCENALKSVKDKCADNSECASNSCVDGACEGKKLDATCNFTTQFAADCAYGLYCDEGSGTCKTASKNDESCTDDRQCLFGYCVDSTCKDFLSIAENGTCDNNAFECAGGNVCGLNTSTCVPYVDVLSKKIDCNQSNECRANSQATLNSECICDIVSNSTLCTFDTAQEKCLTEFSKARDCITKAGCTTVTLAADGCVQSNCKTEVNCFLNCYVDTSCYQDLTFSCPSPTGDGGDGTNNTNDGDGDGNNSAASTMSNFVSFFF